MSGCDYCENDQDGDCDECGAQVCASCSIGIDPDVLDTEVLCNPDPATWPGRGCYKPPVAEVADVP
jgi:hypothetical protein